jgi:phosphonoacetaldehyde hydrolase
MDYGCYAPAVVFAKVFENKGVPITIEEARIPMGAHKRVHIETLTRIPAIAERWRARHGRDPTDADVSEMFADFVPLQMSCLADYADLIPGCVEAVASFRSRGLKIGSTTGYLPEMVELLRAEAHKRGYAPDVSVSAGEVPFGRPEPWMCLENAKLLRIYPLEAIVKVGDTLPDIEEGLSADMWTIGIAKTGNEIGLNEEEIARLPPNELEQRLARAYERLRGVGAHYVVDSIAEVSPILDQIDARLARGERP